MKLEEKHYRRVDKFDGDAAKYRGWMFDRLAAMGLVDGELASESKSLLFTQADADPNKLDRVTDRAVSNNMDNYSSELYGIVCLLTSGEAKLVLRWMADFEPSCCGFKAFLLLQKRLDNQTTASLLQAYLDVVSPAPINAGTDVVAGIHRWEGRVIALNSRYNEDLKDRSSWQF